MLEICENPKRKNPRLSREAKWRKAWKRRGRQLELKSKMRFGGPGGKGLSLKSIKRLEQRARSEARAWFTPTALLKKRKNRRSSPRQLAYRKLVKKYGVKGASRHWKKRR